MKIKRPILLLDEISKRKELSEVGKNYTIKFIQTICYNGKEDEEDI